jgi:hypothetical protein
MRVAIISLPQVNTPVQGILNNLNGYWFPPHVLEHWAGACKVVYDEATFEELRSKIIDSHTLCMQQFYRDNAL